MKNKTINLFDVDEQEDIDKNKTIEELENDYFQEQGLQDNNELEQGLTKDGGLDQLLQNSSSPQDFQAIDQKLSDKDLTSSSNFTLDSDEWNTMGRA